MVDASYWMKLGSHDLSSVDIHAERASSEEIYPVGRVGMFVSLEEEFSVVVGLLSLVPLLAGKPGPAGAIGGAADTGVGVSLSGTGVGTLTGRTVFATVVAGARGESARRPFPQPSKYPDKVEAFRGTLPTSPGRTRGKHIVLFFLRLGHVSGAGDLNREGFWLFHGWWRRDADRERGCGHRRSF